MNIEPSSFKDPSGFVFQYKTRVLRQVNRSYQHNYDMLMNSGLYDKLVSERLLIPHKKVPFKQESNGYIVIEPTVIPFISYSYEWSFSQLKDAALLTLHIQQIALEYGMSLKDASSFNIQFLNGKPILIDTLSFEEIQKGKPWVAYEQYCQQFLAPLALMARRDERLRSLLASNMGSVPLDLAVSLLPFPVFMNPSLFLHLYLHSKSKKRLGKPGTSKMSSASFSSQAFGELINSLESATKSLKQPKLQSLWSDYYTQHSTQNYHDAGLQQKKKVVKEYLRSAKSTSVWDLGANTGVFSRIASQLQIPTISVDNDISSVEQNYTEVKNNSIENILPLYLDIMNPTPSLGWANQERASFLNRPHPDTILCLALIHHVSISNNVPLSKSAQLFASLCTFLIIEFVPKTDHQVISLLAFREDIFPHYTQKEFEKEYGTYFTIVKKTTFTGTKRVLYLMKIKKS